MKMRISRFSRAWLAFMVAALCWGGAVTQAVAQCATFPTGYVPFMQVYATYPVSPGSVVVGAMTSASYVELLSGLPLPSSPGETFCSPVQLAPGFFVIAYVPTAAERLGDFAAYLPFAQLLDPLNDAPYLDDSIPPGLGIFAWHIAGPVPAPPAATGAIISLVNTLNSQGVLNSGQQNSLVKQLQKALEMMNAGKINGAIGILQSFIREVQDLESSGVLATDQATVLINAGNFVIAELRES